MSREVKNDTSNTFPGNEISVCSMDNLLFLSRLPRGHGSIYADLA